MATGALSVENDLPSDATDAQGPRRLAPPATSDVDIGIKNQIK
jgi:hypothetical protein